MSNEFDRELLFGVLALRNGLISREQLTAALKAWSADKSKPLRGWLVQLKVIDDSFATAFEQIVDRHVQQHGGKPENSLDSAGTDPEVCDTLGAVQDPLFQASLTRMTVRRTPSPPMAGGQYRPGDPTARCDSSQRFQTLRHHAQGGLGRICIALDTELHREVAVKEIHADAADDPFNRQRFTREAEITGGLEHPNIVPVYSLGTYPDGRPFYAMKFIQGESLLDAIRTFHAPADGGRPTPRRLDTPQGALELRQHLGRMVDVCQALAFAHSRQVLHRDLKPGNIMLGKFGETLVVDWGLAKTLPEGGVPESAASVRFAERLSTLDDTAHGGAATLPGTAVGTPQYMSPEQASGRLDEMGPTTDVYSVGATLYHLLAGQSSVAHDSLERMLKVVREGTIRPVREVNPTVPRPLAAICHKALSLAPEDRYADTKLLAEDLERWLAGEPVTAYRENLVERTRRWLRRNRAWTTSIATALVALALVSAAFAQQKSLLASRERNAREEADARYAEALESYEFLIDNVQEKLAGRVGLSALKKSILSGAAERLEKLAARTPQSLRGDRLTAAAALKLGKLLLETDGQVSAAQQQFETALRLSQTLADSHPNDQQAQRDLGRAYVELGRAYSRRGTSHDPLQSLERALKIFRETAGRSPDDANAQLELSNACIDLGEHLRTQNRQADAVPYFEEAVDISRKLKQRFPDDVSAQRNMALVCERIAAVLKEVDQSAKSREYTLESHAIRVQVAKDHPDFLPAQDDLQVSCADMAELALTERRLPEARRLFQQSMEILQHLRQLAIDAVDDADSRRSVAIGHQQLGRVALAQHSFIEAVASQRTSLAEFERLASLAPDDARAQHELVTAHTNLHEALMEVGLNLEAIEHCRKAEEVARTLIKSAPDDTRGEEGLARALFKLGYAQAMAFRYNDARASFAQSFQGMDALQKAGRLPPQNRSWAEDARMAIDFAEIAGAALAVWPNPEAQRRFAAYLPPPFDSTAALLTDRAGALTLAGKHAEAEEMLALLKQRPPISEDPGRVQFNLAGGYARCAWALTLPPGDVPSLASARPGNEGRVLTADETVRRTRYIDAAFAALEDAVKAGFRNVDDLYGDPALTGIRFEPRFEQVRQRMSAIRN